MSAPWARITDDAYKSWLLEAMTAEEYNGLGPVERRTLLTQFQQQQQQAPSPKQFSEETVAGLAQFATDYQTRKRTIVLSGATSSTKNDLMDMLNMQEKGAGWRDRTAVSQSGQHVDGFLWLKSNEDSDENREGYMAHLNAFIQKPVEYALADVQPDRDLLTVHFLRSEPESRQIRGTTDVVIAKSVHVNNAAIRNNIEALIELKKPQNLQEKDHTPQTIGEHFAASYLNIHCPVVSVLTDLNDSWTFFWFARGEDCLGSAALYKICLKGSSAAAEAKHILNSLFVKDVPEDRLPATFANRISLQAALECVATSKKTRIESSGHDEGAAKPAGGSDESPTPKRSQHASSQRGGKSDRNNQSIVRGNSSAPMNMTEMLSLFAPPADRDVANELDLLDMVDENEQYEIIRSFALKHIVPYMKG